MDWRRAGERTHVIYRVSVMGHLLAHIDFHLHSWQLALSPFGGSGSEALGRARPLSEVMQLVSRAELEPSLWKAHHTDSRGGSTTVRGKQPLYWSAPFVHMMSASGRPDKQLDASIFIWTGAHLHAHPFAVPPAPRGQCSFFMSPSPLLWHELTRAGATSYFL